MTHRFIILQDEILTIDDAQELDDAVDAMLEAGVQQCLVWVGGPETQLAYNHLLTQGGLIEVSAEVFEMTRSRCG